MNWDEELEAAQARMDERESLWRNAVAAGSIGSAFAETWFESLTPEQRDELREIAADLRRQIMAAFENLRDAFVELGRFVGEQLRPVLDAFGITANELYQRKYDANAPRLYWDGKRVERVGRYRPYRSKRDKR